MIPFPVVTFLDTLVAADWCEDAGLDGWASALREPPRSRSGPWSRSGSWSRSWSG